VTVLGLPSLLASLTKRYTEIEAASKEGLMAGAEQVKEAWVANIVADDLVLTGHYRDSVHVETDGEVTAAVSDVAYGGVLEYGDSRQAAHFPATRAAEEHHADVLDAVHDKVSKAL
jgi:hypothetical protein